MIRENYRNKVYRQTLFAKLKNEHLANWIGLSALIYALISNILYYCPPLPIDEGLLNFMASIDNLAKNICYGIIGCVIFYLFHDTIRNHGNFVDTYNDMFQDLHVLWWSFRRYLSSSVGENFQNEQNMDIKIKKFYQHICNKNPEKVSAGGISTISFQEVELLSYIWENAITQKKQLLNIYGNHISREEFVKLYNNEYDICLQRLKDYIEKAPSPNENKMLTIRNFDIIKTAYLMFEIEENLAKMVKKYSVYDYSDTKKNKKMP